MSLFPLAAADVDDPDEAMKSMTRRETETEYCEDQISLLQAQSLDPLFGDIALEFLPYWVGRLGELNAGKPKR